MTTCLNVGCNDIQLEGFINIDLNPSVKPDLIWDATKLRDKFVNDSVDFIFCGHFLEHFSVAVSSVIVRDFYSMLKPYGCVAAIVPDFKKAVGVTASVELTTPEIERIVLAEGTHKMIFTEDRLVSIFEHQGFSAIPAPVTLLPWCRFPEVPWQSAVLAMKHPTVNFTTG